MEKQKRLFTAIRFPESTIDQIADIENELIKNDPKARFVKPITNFHITLYYIGPVKETTIVDEAFKKACQRYQEEVGRAININFTDLNFFRRKRGNILWLGVEPNENLNKLYNYIVEELKETGLKVTGGHYTPHITIARNYEGKIIENFKRPDLISADKAYLVWSHRNEEDVLVYDNLTGYSLVK